eukprot:2925038-Pyramimonas_sp.AAC.1
MPSATTAAAAAASPPHGRPRAERPPPRLRRTAGPEPSVQPPPASVRAGRIGPRGIGMKPHGRTQTGKEQAS